MFQSERRGEFLADSGEFVGGANCDILRVAQDDNLSYEQIFKKRTIRRAASSRENRQDE